MDNPETQAIFGTRHRDTGNIWHKTQNEDTKQKLKECLIS